MRLPAFDAALQAVFAQNHGSPEEIRKRSAKAVAEVLKEARAGVRADFEALSLSGMAAGQALPA